MPANEKTKSSFSDESLTFRRLSKAEKYKKLIEFCKEHNQSPRTYNRPEEERVLGQFLVNMRALAKRNPNSIESWEHNYLKEVTTYSIYQRNPLKRLNDILDWTKQNEKTPSQSSNDDTEKKFGQSLNAMKLSAKKKKLSDDEVNILNKILEYRTNHQRTREEKLGDVIEFCRKHNRTPKQHVSDSIEKRLAEFLTTTKGLLKKNPSKVSKNAKDLLNVIMEFAPPTKESRTIELYQFAKKNQRKPEISSDDISERRLASYLSKLKTAFNKNELDLDESKKVTEILSLCKIKTRADKLSDVLEWKNTYNKLPSISSKNIEEKKLGMFLNNIKQVNKKKPDTISDSERLLINKIGI